MKQRTRRKLMSGGTKTVIYPVKDVAKAKALFSQVLGTQPNMDEPYYVNFSVAGQDVGLDPNGHDKGMTGPVVYWNVDDIRGTVKTLLDAGAELQEHVRDVGGGKLVATVKDADGNAIGLMQS
jgi:predicted enzyme related to lactoylglutathione lyase